MLIGVVYRYIRDGPQYCLGEDGLCGAERGGERCGVIGIAADDLNTLGRYGWLEDLEVSRDMARISSWVQ